MIIKRKIFLDLDGVMADFEKYFQDTFNIRHDAVDDAEMWRHINSIDHFFRELPPMEGADYLYRELSRYGMEVIALTGCPRNYYQRAALQKREWAREHIDPNMFVLPVVGGKNKFLFMHNPGDILIDDFDKNLKPWREYGGVGILHRNVEDTIVDFRAELVANGIYSFDDFKKSHWLTLGDSK